MNSWTLRRGGERGGGVSLVPDWVVLQNPNSGLKKTSPGI